MRLGYRGKNFAFDSPVALVRPQIEIFGEQGEDSLDVEILEG